MERLHVESDNDAIRNMINPEKEKNETAGELMIEGFFNHSIIDI